MDTAEALLLTGVYGTGKSTIAEEIADILERRGTRFAAIDLDWLAWSNAPGASHDEHAILARNLAAVAAIYRQAGVERFVLAGSVDDDGTLEAIRSAVGVPVRVVRLTAPLEVIEARLGAVPTTGRRDDLHTAREALLAGPGQVLWEHQVENVGPVRATAERVLDLIGWS